MTQPVKNEEAFQLVTKLSAEAQDLILKRTAYVSPGQRWLIVGRIVQNLFHSHFLLSYIASATAASSAELEDAQYGRPETEEPNTKRGKPKSKDIKKTKKPTKKKTKK